MKRFSLKALQLTFLSAAFFLAGNALSDPFPPTLANGAAHFPPVAWPAEPANPQLCGNNCGEWLPYTRFQSGITDPRTQDPSNGGTAPQNYVNIASSCVDKTAPSVYYALRQGAAPDGSQDTIMFRWRVEQIANTYATGPSAGAYASSDPWSSALWSVMFDVDGDGYLDLAAHLDGSSGSPSASIDRIAGIWSKLPTQSLDYLADPTNVKLLAHNPAGFVDPVSGRLLNFSVRNGQNEPQPTWLNGSAESVWDYGTTRAKKVSTSPCNEYFVDYQIPVALLDASAQGGPKITRNTPISMVFCTANSLNNPFQKDCAINSGFVGQSGQAAPFGDYISFTQAAPYSQPIISSVVAAPPNTCPGSYTLTANVQDTLAVVNGQVVPSVKAARFYYYYDANGNGLADDGGDWTFAANATLKAGSMNIWVAAWSGAGLPKGSYLIGVQALDDNTLVDNGITPSGINNRTFSYVAGDAQNRIYVDGTSYAPLPGHSPAMATSSTENWWGNPSVTGSQVALVGLALNNCGVAPTLNKTASAANVAVGGTVDYTFVVSNTLTQSLSISRVEDALPSGFSYVSTTAGSLAPTASPANGATGAVVWDFSPPVSLPPGGSGSFGFRAQAASTSGQYNNTATATTSFGALVSAPVPVAVDAVRLSFSKTPSTYQATPDGTTPLVYTLRYANDSTVPVTGASITDTLPAGVTFVSCSGGASACSFAAGVVTWPLGTVDGGGSGSVQLTVTVNNDYSGSSLSNTATLSGTDAGGAPVSQTATASVSVPVGVTPAAAFSLTKTASSAQVAPGANVTWTLSYTNTGNAAASGVTLSDPIPEGFTFVSCTGGCSNSSGTLTWSVGSVAAGASGSVTVTAAAASPFTAFNPVTNTATINWSGNSGSPVTASVQTGVTGQSCSKYYFRNSLLDVGGGHGSRLIANQAAAAPTGAGATQQVAVPANAGSYVTALEFYTDPVTASSVDFNGAITSYIYVDRANGPGLLVRTEVFDFNTTTGLLTAIGAPADIQMNGSTKGLVKDSTTNAAPTFNANGTLQKGHRLLFRYSVKSANTQTFNVYFQYDGNVVTNPISGGTATDAPSRGEFCVTPPANLSFSKSVNLSTVTAGVQTSVQYTLRFDNTGQAKATGVEVVDTLPTGVTFVSATLNGSAITPSVAGQQLTFSGVRSSTDAVPGEVSGGTSGTLVINATVEASATGSLTNTASISSTQTAPNTAIATTVAQTSGGGGGSPQLVVQLTADRTSALPGETVVYTATVVNIGTAAASNVVLEAGVPTRSYYIYGTCGGSCSASASLVQWSIPTLAVGASVSYTFTMQAGSTGLAAGISVVPNQASASATSVAPVSSNTVNVSISGNPLLGLLKSVAGPTPAAPGNTLTYTLQVTNSGSVAATGVRVLDPVPAGTTYAGALTTSSGTGSFDAINNRVVFDVGSLASGGSATLSFAVKVNAMSAGSTTIMNTATASAQNAPGVTAMASKTAGAQASLSLTKQAPAQVSYPAATLTQSAMNTTQLRVNDSSQLSLGQYVSLGGSVARVADLSPTTLTLASPVTAPAGSLIKAAITYTLSYANTGSAAADSVVLTDTLPAGLDWVASMPSASVSGSTVTWSLGTLQPGETGSVQLVALPQSSGSYLNQASINCTTCGAAVPASASTSVGGLVVTKRTTTPALAAGSVAEYVIEVRNTSTTAITPVTVTDVLAAGFTYENTVAILNNGTPVAANSAPAPGDTVLAWGNFAVQPGQALSVQFQARVSTQAGTGTYQNDAGATPLNRTVPYDFLRSTAEDVTVLGADAGLIVGVVYEDTDNNGLLDPSIDLPMGNVPVRFYDSSHNITYEEITDAAGRYARVVPLGTWTVQAMTPDQSSGQTQSGSVKSLKTASIVVSTKLTLRSNFNNPATVTVGSSQAVQVDMGYVSALGVSDLTIAKSHTGNFSQGQTGAQYRLVVTNTGASPTVGTVTVTDTLPAGLTATGAAGAGWACSLGGTVVCSRSDALNAADSYPTITLTVSVAANAAASVTNTATVDGGGETNTANNSASDVTPITPFIAAADLTLTKSHASNFTRGQTSGVYSLVVSNIGASATTGTVNVTDVLPAGLTATGMAGSGWSCTLAPLACSRSDSLAAGASYPTITLTVAVAANATSPVTNQATVDGGGETNTTNNTALDPTIVNAPAAAVDLGIAKSHAGNFRPGQAGALYQLVVINYGGSASTGVVTVTDALPAGLTATAISGTGWSCNLGSLSCTRSDALAAGAAWPAITVKVTVSAQAPASVINVATVSGGGDATPGNNSASDITTIAPATPASIPTLSEWGMLLLTLLMAGAVAWPARRPRAGIGLLQGRT